MRGRWHFLTLFRVETADPIDDIVAKAREALKIEKSESRRWERRVVLQEVEKELEAAQVGMPAPDIRVQTLLAEIATNLREWKRAAEIWSEVDRLSAKPRSDSIAQLAVTLAESGNFEEAAAHIGRLGGKNKAEQRRVRRRTSAWVSDYLVRLSHEANTAGSSGQAKTLLEAAQLLRGRSEKEARTVALALQAVADFRHQGSTGLPRRTYPALPHAQAKPVFVSGFLYSGSGAVSDYLKALPGVSTGLTTQELGCFFGSYGPTKILSSKGSSIRDSVAKFVSWPLLGVLPPHRKHPYAPKASLAYVLKGDGVIDELSAIGLTLLTDLDEPEQCSEECVKDSLKRAFARILALNKDDGEFLLINNSLRPYEYDLLELLPQSSAVAVVRDPRDQFVSQKIESPSPIDLETFIKQSRERYHNFFEYLSKGRYRDCVVCVRFEEFVSSEQVRRGVLEAIGIPACDVRDAETLDFSSSQKNIGIHRKHGNPSEIERIEAQLEEFFPAGMSSTTAS